MFWRAAFLAWAAVALGVHPAHAQNLIVPDQIVLHVHKDMKETDFVEGLVCELGRVMTAEVRATASDFPLEREYLLTRTQLDPRRIFRPFLNRQPIEGGRTFHVLLLPYDLKVAELNYVFAETYMAPNFVAIMSTIRLTPHDPALSRKQVSDTTGERLYKLLLKSVARMAGLDGNGCVLAFPRSLDELDAKSAEFCPADRAALVQAGVLKDKPFGACNTVAMADL